MMENRLFMSCRAAKSGPSFLSVDSNIMLSADSKVTGNLMKNI